LDTTEIFICCVRYNGRKTLALWDTMEDNLSNILRIFHGISRNEGKPLLLYPTMEENLLS
jgi:hypothetical protein